jgi:hypothetical protein
MWGFTGSGFGEELLPFGVEPGLRATAVEDGHCQSLLQFKIVSEGSRAGVHLPRQCFVRLIILGHGKKGFLSAFLLQKSKMEAGGPPEKKRARRDDLADSTPTGKENAVEEEWSAFERVKKNRAACLQFLVGLTQRIERLWLHADQEEARVGSTGTAGGAPSQQPVEAVSFCEARERVVGRIVLLRRCLDALHDHRDPDLREVARLADKI